MTSPYSDKNPWEVTREDVKEIYPDNNNSVLPEDILILTLRFLIKEHKTYYDNGCVKSITHYSRLTGKKHGDCICFIRNGDKVSHSQHLNGVLHGLQSFYFSGKLLVQILYVHGKPIHGDNIRFRRVGDDIIWHDNVDF